MTIDQPTVAPDDIAINPLTEADAERFWSLRLRALRDHPEAFGPSYEEERATPIAEARAHVPSPPDGLILGAWRGADLVGTVVLRRMDPEKHRHKAILGAVYVVPEARGRGVAHRLLTAILAAARDLPGLEQIQLVVGSRSPAARHLYASLGFVPFGLERRATRLGPGDYVDEEHMVLFLDPDPGRPETGGPAR